MAALVAVLVIAVAGAAAFVTKTVWFTLIAEMEILRKPPQLRHADWQEEHRRRVAQLPADVQEAHKHASRHRAEVLRSGLCGCFYCCSTFSPQDITRWTDEVGGEGQTALCPRCGIDSVLGDRSGFELSPGFLLNMKSCWF
jgi:hypothetical protein